MAIFRTPRSHTEGWPLSPDHFPGGMEHWHYIVTDEASHNVVLVWWTRLLSVCHANYFSYCFSFLFYTTCALCHFTLGDWWWSACVNAFNYVPFRDSSAYLAPYTTFWLVRWSFWPAIHHSDFTYRPSVKFWYKGIHGGDDIYVIMKFCCTETH
jgi:hypothetical protein